MLYTLDKTHYRDFKTFALNKLPGRSYFIPYPNRQEADAVSTLEKRYRSSKVVCLNGDWDFCFYPQPARMPETLDTDKAAFTTIDVPSCWQFRGYDRPFYVNIRYQFPFKPPKIPEDEKAGKVFTWLGVDQKIRPRLKDPGEEYNFAGIYRKNVDIEDNDKNIVISFLGVASCLDLYLNGEWVGYSEGAHNTAEFDLTGKARKGKNEIVCVVRRWCNGTYLEGQDMFRNNGIFRDVLLRLSDKEDIREIGAVTSKTDSGWRVALSAETYSDTMVTFTLTGHGVKKTAFAQAVNGHTEVTLEGIDAQPWSAESPVLYDLYYETPTCCVKERLGFKTVEIKGDVFLLNGKKVKFKGVNHHDTSPTGGYTMTPQEIKRDVEICKAYNIDTIRTSHYPPDPLLLELADEYGIYIVDENDLETHGTFAHQLPPTYNTISNDPKWEGHYLDRITRLYERDKVHANTCIVMWSLGNEAGGYCNTDSMYQYLKEHSSLPVHYESAIHCKRQAYDVGSEMYPSVKNVHLVGEKKRRQQRLNDRPYFLCEYAHAMGVGPGNTEAYWQEIYQYDSLMGGCVWEMVDHAVCHKDGTYTYGGDHGEWEHDGNFCVDGLFYPDREPSVGAKIIRFIYRPVRVSLKGGSTFEVFNTTAFSEGKRYLMTLLWNDGTVREVSCPAGPLSRADLPVQPGKEVNGNLSCIVTVTDTLTGQAVSREQVVLKSTVPDAPERCPLPEWFDLKNGAPVITLPDGNSMTASDPGIILYRAATDNDTDPMFSNTMKPYYAQKETVEGVDTIPNGLSVRTKVTNKKGAFLVTDTYEGVADGVLVTSRLHPLSGRGIIPRFGKAFRLEKDYDRVLYRGRAGESYCDMKDQFPIEQVQCTVADMTEPNIRPQESGNRCDCTMVQISSDKGTVRFDAVKKPFELGIKPYTDKALTTMRHREDETATGTYVTVQAFQQGIGTGACGPAIMPEFQYPADRDYEMAFVIRIRD